MLVICDFTKTNCFHLFHATLKSGTVLEANAEQSLLFMFKQTLRKSRTNFRLLKKFPVSITIACDSKNTGKKKQKKKSAVINGNRCLLSDAGLQGLVGRDASVSTAGVNAQRSGTEAMLTAHKHPLSQCLEPFVQAHTHTSLGYLHCITFVPLPPSSQLAGSDLSCSELSWPE